MNEDKRAFYQRRLLEELRQADCASSNWVRKLHRRWAREYQDRLEAMCPPSDLPAQKNTPAPVGEANELGNWTTELW